MINYYKSEMNFPASQKIELINEFQNIIQFRKKEIIDV